MIKKVLTIGALWWIINFCYACCEVLPYYLYSSIDISIPATEISLMDSLIITIDPTETNFVANANPSMLRAHALTCTQGENGAKFPIEYFDIITQQDFDSNHLEGSSVKNLFRIEYYDKNTYERIDVLLSDLTDLTQLFYNTIYTKDRPSLNNEIKFRIELTNSKREEFNSETAIITWQ